MLTRYFYNGRTINRQVKDKAACMFVVKGIIVVLRQQADGSTGCKTYKATEANLDRMSQLWSKLPVSSSLQYAYALCDLPSGVIALFQELNWLSLSDGGCYFFKRVHDTHLTPLKKEGWAVHFTHLMINPLHEHHENCLYKALCYEYPTLFDQFKGYGAANR
jgi:hypothetical protein